MRFLTGSIGTLESTVMTEVEFEDLTKLDEAFQKMANIPAHAAWGKKMEPHVVSGTNHWEILRVI